VEPRINRVASSLALVLVMTVFGLTFIAIKIALQELGPYMIAFIRFTIATISLSLIRWSVQTKGRIDSLPWVRLSLMGFLGVTLFFSLQNLGLTYTTASSASLVLSSIPAITAIISSLVLRETIGWLKITGISLSMIGVTLVVLGGSRSPFTFEEEIIGDIMILLCALLWALYTVISRRLIENIPYLTVTWLSTAFGTLFLTPLAVIEFIHTPPSTISFPTARALLFLGVVASALALLLYNYALSRREASEVALYVNLSPLITVIAAKIFLKESLSPLQLFGGIIVLSSIYIVNR